jgi:transcriptional regulator GlxA family with amidase domain
MDECARLLISTELPISEIASQLGCPDAKNLARYFRQSMGLSPLEYRKQHCIE